MSIARLYLPQMSSSQQIGHPAGAHGPPALGSSASLTMVSPWSVITMSSPVRMAPNGPFQRLMPGLPRIHGEARSARSEAATGIKTFRHQALRIYMTRWCVNELLVYSTDTLVPKCIDVYI